MKIITNEFWDKLCKCSYCGHDFKIGKKEKFIRLNCTDHYEHKPLGINFCSECFEKAIKLYEKNK